MTFNFRRIFNPTPEEEEEEEKHCRQIYEQQCEKRGCSTCRNCKQMYRYPGFVTAEECVCTAGLECDTVLDSIKNCERYERIGFKEKIERNPALDEVGVHYVLRNREQ